MKRLLAAGIAVAALLGAAAPTPGAEAPADSSAMVADSTLAFRIQVGSRLYPDWSETLDVSLGEAFFIGDSPFTGRVTAFMPDFGIEHGKARNYSAQLANPAVRVFVHADSGAVDSTWAFLNFPPHFSPKAFFTFRLVQVRGYDESPPSATSEPPKKEE